MGVKVLFAPLFLYNPLYGHSAGANATVSSGQARPGTEGDGFEIQSTFVPPLRPTAPRFPVLPVAMASTLANSSPRDFDGFSASRAAESTSGAGRDTVSSLMQQVGTGLGFAGLGKALGGN